MHKTLKASLLKLGFTIFLTLLVIWISFYSHFIETVYFNGFYRGFSIALRYLSHFFGFEIGTILYGLLIVFIVYQLFRLARKIYKRALPWQILPVKALHFVLVLFIAFKLFWGFNYDRPPIAQKLGIKNEKYNPDDLLALANYLMDKLNTLKPQIDSTHARPSAYQLAYLQTEAVKTYRQMATINAVYNYPVPSIKACMFKNTITNAGIEGYYNPLTGEANINMQIPAFVLPFVICHEISHQTGIAKEDEANLIGYLVSIHSEDINFKYAGYYNVFRNVLREIQFNAPENLESIIERLNPSVKKDFDAENEFWLKHNALLSKYMGSMFDKVLKINKQTKGIDSYQDIVLWLYNYHKHELSNNQKH